MYMVHGTFNELTRWMKVHGSGTDDPNTPSSSEPSSGSYDLTDKGNRNSPENFLIITAEGGIEPLDKLRLYSRADLLLIWNKNNIKGDFASDFQFTFGVKYSF